MMTTNRRFNIDIVKHGKKDRSIYRDAYQITDKFKKHALNISTSSLYRMRKGDKKYFITSSGIQITVECTS